ncbi:MAG: ArsR/SmtB family transcription factor [Syntrophobacteraceae bacterium]
MPEAKVNMQWGTLFCPAKTPIQERSLISAGEAQRIETIFKVLANATRLRLLHALVRSSELCVTEIAASIGMKPQAVSNQLQRLADRGILSSRREGIQIYYRIVDPCVVRILEYGWCLSDEATV